MRTRPHPHRLIPGRDVYLDNAATSFPKPAAVYRAVSAVMRQNGASAGRGGYRRAQRAGAIMNRTRHLLGTLFNIPDPNRVVFTANITESLTLALSGTLNPGDRVVTSSMEHHAVWRCLKALERERGISIHILPSGPDGTMDPRLLENALDPAPALVVMLHASNVTGGLMPVCAAGRLCRERGVPLLVDCAQTAGVVPIDVIRDHISMLAFTGHKSLLGPQGTGGLYIAEGHSPRPLKYGGTGTRSLEDDQPPSPPDRYESGTMNVPGIAGLGEGVKFLLREGVEQIWRHEQRLVQRLLEGLGSIPGIKIYGPGDPQKMVGVVSFNIDGWKPGDAATVLDQRFGLLLRAGYHCAPRAHQSIGTLDRGTVRAAPGYSSTLIDVNYLLEALDHLATSSRRRP